MTNFLCGEQSSLRFPNLNRVVTSRGDPLAIRRPSYLMNAVRMVRRGHRTCCAAPSTRAFKISTVPPAEAEAISFPSGDQATADDIARAPILIIWPVFWPLRMVLFWRLSVRVVGLEGELRS